MKIALLARNEDSPTTGLMRKSADRLGIELNVFRTDELRVQSDQDRVRIFRQNEELLAKDFAWIWPRIGPLSRAEGCLLNTAFESAGFKVVDSTASLRTASDKIESLIVLRGAKLPVPPSWFFFPWTKWDPTQIAGERFWIKTQLGSQGLGVSWADSKTHALAQVDLIRMNQGSGVLQAHVSGDDVRALVWRGRVLGAMKRESATSENPRANFSLGGRVSAFELPAWAEALALKAAQVFGLQLAGVDLLLSKNDARILEVNPCPGFAGLSEALNRDVASEILDDLAKG